MSKQNYLLLLSTVVATSTNCVAEELSRPNIIYLLADDVGYGDIGCYGQEYIKTPNIDRMAQQGVRFTQHYAGSAVSAPSRSTLMTGCHTGHSPIRDNSKNKGVTDPTQDVIAGNSMARIFKNAGYATGAFGKWGIGGAGSNTDAVGVGFDRFYGFNNQVLAHNHYPYSLISDRKKVMLEGNEGSATEEYAPDLIHAEAMKFIEQNSDKPFFAYLPYTLAHVELAVPDDEIVQGYRETLPPGESYRGVLPGEKGYKAGAYGPADEPRSIYAAMVGRLDKYIGEIYSKLDELGIAENTIVIFASDNGPTKEGGNDVDFFNSAGGLRGMKRDLFEGGIRIPMLVTWPAKIKEAKETDILSGFWDIMPTLAECAGLECFPGIDGLSLYPTLVGEGEQQLHEYLYWEYHSQGGKIAIRYGDWKGVKLKYGELPDAQMLLYNIATDPCETVDVADQNPEIVNKIEDILKNARSETPLYNFRRALN